MKTNFRFLLAAAALFFAASASHAQSYGFSCVTHTYDTSCAGGEAQLALTVSGIDGDVNFRLTNTGPMAMSITDVYFDWTSALYALTPDVISSSPGVSFSWGANPSNLPGGGSFSANIGADSNAPVQNNGVNPGEWLDFSFEGSYDTFISGLNSNQLRVGLHVQGFTVGDGASESFVSISTTSPVTAPVPEPGTYALMAVGLAVIVMTARRRQWSR